MKYRIKDSVNLEELVKFGFVCYTDEKLGYMWVYISKLGSRIIIYEQDMFTPYGGYLVWPMRTLLLRYANNINEDKSLDNTCRRLIKNGLVEKVGD